MYKTSLFPTSVAPALALLLLPLTTSCGGGASSSSQTDADSLALADSIARADSLAQALLQPSLELGDFGAGAPAVGDYQVIIEPFIYLGFETVVRLRSCYEQHECALEKGGEGRGLALRFKDPRQCTWTSVELYNFKKREGKEMHGGDLDMFRYTFWDDHIEGLDFQCLYDVTAKRLGAVCGSDLALYLSRDNNEQPFTRAGYFEHHYDDFEFVLVMPYLDFLLQETQKEANCPLTLAFCEASHLQIADCPLSAAMCQVIKETTMNGMNLDEEGLREELNDAYVGFVFHGCREGSSGWLGSILIDYVADAESDDDVRGGLYDEVPLGEAQQ